MITIRDVAKHAGVSCGTASRAIHDVGYVSSETKRKVLFAVEQLGYIANQTAQQLKKGKSNVIGLIVSDINNYFYNIVISQLAEKLKEDGKTIMLTYSNESAKEERECFYTLFAAKVSAIIFTPVCDSNYDLICKAAENGIFVTQLYRRIYNANAIIFDDEYSAYQSMCHFFDIGCRRPLLIDVNYYNLNSETVVPNRTEGFLRAVEEYRITDYRYIKHNLLESRDPEFERLFLEFKPDCVLSGNSQFTLELLDLLEKYNLTYPKNIKIISFDDIGWIAHLKLSAIHQPVENLVENLIPVIYQKNSAKLIKIKSPLIKRKSTTVVD